jgi:hypothetical protein
MLEPSEAADVYSQLSKLAIAHGLDWLIADVEVQIALGKQETKDMQVSETVASSQPNSSPQRRGRKASFVVIQRLTEREKLCLLIEALEAASVGLSLGILDTYQTIGEVTHGLRAIGFAPDVDGGRVTLVTPDIIERKESILRLGTLLGELKESV